MSVDILTLHMQEKKWLIMPIGYSKMSVTYPVSRKKIQFTVQKATVDSELYWTIPYNIIEVVKTDSGFENTSSFIYRIENIIIPYYKWWKKNEIINEMSWNYDVLLLD